MSSAASISTATALSSEVESLGSDISSALSPVTAAEQTVKSIADAIDDSAKLVETIVTEHNTPAMIANKESAEEQEEKDLDNKVVEEAMKGNKEALETLRERSS